MKGFVIVVFVAASTGTMLSLLSGFLWPSLVAVEFLLHLRWNLRTGSRGPVYRLLEVKK